jgi:hypothetical protein
MDRRDKRVSSNLLGLETNPEYYPMAIFFISVAHVSEPGAKIQDRWQQN